MSASHEHDHARQSRIQVNILEAKSQLSRLVKAAVSGEEVTIAANGKPLGKLVSIESRRRERKPGAWAKRPPPAPDWDAPEQNREVTRELARERDP